MEGRGDGMTRDRVLDGGASLMPAANCVDLMFDGLICSLLAVELRSTFD